MFASATSAFAADTRPEHCMSARRSIDRGEALLALCSDAIFAPSSLSRPERALRADASCSAALAEFGEALRLTKEHELTPPSDTCIPRSRLASMLSSLEWHEAYQMNRIDGRTPLPEPYRLPVEATSTYKDR